MRRMDRLTSSTHPDLSHNDCETAERCVWLTCRTARHLLRLSRLWAGIVEQEVFSWTMCLMDDIEDTKTPRSRYLPH